jgi:hypothetical protein
MGGIDDYTGCAGAIAATNQKPCTAEIAESAEKILGEIGRRAELTLRLAVFGLA